MWGEHRSRVSDACGRDAARRILECPVLGGVDVGGIAIEPSGLQSIGDGGLSTVEPYRGVPTCGTEAPPGERSFGTSSIRRTV
jgi:hypothetical protein